MPELRHRYFDSRKTYADHFKETHSGVLNAKTKELGRRRAAAPLRLAN